MVSVKKPFPKSLVGYGNGNLTVGTHGSVDGQVCQLEYIHGSLRSNSCAYHQINHFSVCQAPVDGAVHDLKPEAATAHAAS